MWCFDQSTQSVTTVSSAVTIAHYTTQQCSVLSLQYTVLSPQYMMLTLQYMVLSLSIQCFHYRIRKKRIGSVALATGSLVHISVMKKQFASFAAVCNC